MELDKAHEAFDRATGKGRALWPSQREAYCAGYLEAEAAQKTSQELLQKAVVDAYEVINHIIELDMLTPGGSTVGWACSVRSDLLQALPPAKRAELD